MTRMIERWFPCKEVSDNSNTGWGSGNQEKNLFTWFAARPTAQAKAAVICSLLQWPDDPAEQERLQDLVREVMTGRYAAWDELRARILADNPDGVSVLDPFSGRGMIPLEAARLGLTSYGIDYSPVAVLASTLLTDYPFRDWSEEPSLPFGEQHDSDELFDSGKAPRLLRDVETVLAEVGRRYSASMAEFYPEVNGKQPWGYLWAITLPCQECGNRFPLVGSLELRKPIQKPATKSRSAFSDPGQSFYVEADAKSGSFRAVVHEGGPKRTPTLVNATGADGRKIKGKSAVCPFCDHVHPLALHQRLAGEGLSQDAMLVVGDVDEVHGKVFREPIQSELLACASAETALRAEPPFSPVMPAIPDERIPLNNGATIRPQLYGANTYGDLMPDRQTLSYVRLARIIGDVADELMAVGVSRDYTQALTGYVAAQLVRKLKFSTRGAQLDPQCRDGNNRIYVNHIFANESTIAFSHDFFEPGIGDGPGTWLSMASSGLTVLRGLIPEKPGLPTTVSQGSATRLPFADSKVQAVVTDPPYDAMVYYSDSSDLFFAWLKRALFKVSPELSVTSDTRGLQDKTDEIIVKEHGRAPGEHRDRDHYDRLIAQSFSEMARLVRADGLVTIVFGHGEPEVWQRLLGALQSAGLVMTGSWPATTESGGSQGKANIRTTLTMACRPADENRPPGRKGTVEAAIKAEVKARYPDWERWGLAPTDMLMAAAGPAMEIVGQYSEILDAKGEQVDIATFLPIARAAVQEAMAVEIDHHPLETFDARTRFALWWVRLFGREVAAKSELRWQALAASLELTEVRDLVPDTDKGAAFVQAARFSAAITPESPVIDVALALAAVSDQGRDAMGAVLAASGRDSGDAYLWAAVKFLADRLPDSDPDSIAFNRVLRAREGISQAAQAIEVAAQVAAQEDAESKRQEKLF